MATLKEKKMNKRVKNQQDYLNKFGRRISANDGTVPSYAQYMSLNSTGRTLAEKGVDYKKIKRMY